MPTDTDTGGSWQLPPGECTRIVTAARERIAAASQTLGRRLLPDEHAAAARVVLGSDYVVRVFERYPEAVLAAFDAGEFDRPTTPACFGRRLGTVEADDEAALKRSLREARHIELARILWRDMTGAATLDETLEALSMTADAAIRLALHASGRALEGRHGVVRAADGRPVALTALAMGKLGGNELNVSSDVDLIFVYGSAGDSDGARSLAAEDYFTRQARRCIALLDDVTADGFAYRVDVRLRPFGDSGALVTSHDALESYLTLHGRDWERYAYVKARLLGGDDDDRAAVSALLDPFVYRRYLDYGVFASLREMKRKIQGEVDRLDRRDNLKLGPGGIREIEFIVQSLQLVRGGSEPELKQRSLLAALAALARAGHVDPHDAKALGSAYRFLRTIENRIQALADQQRHVVPDESTERLRLAAALGFADPSLLIDALDRERRVVAGQFERVVFRTQADSDAHDESVPDAFEASVAACRDSAGEAFAQRVIAYREEIEARPLDEESERRIGRLLPEMARAALVNAEPAACFDRLTRVLDKILRRSAYVSLLIENPGALARFVTLAGNSEFIANELAAMPALLDELLDHRLHGAALDEAALEGDLDVRRRRLDADDVEARLEALARFKRAAQFRVAVADLSAALPLMRVADLLTRIAELSVAEALALAEYEQRQRYGAPMKQTDGQVRPAALAVIGYGKLGGLELGYGSDLDLVFLHDSPGDGAETAGPRRIDNDVYFQRLVRRVIHFLTMQTSTGQLYEVDLRLRPSGRSGLLISSLDAFERYQQADAWTWEHQALLRSRAVAGDAGLGRAFEAVRRRTLKQFVRRDRLASDVATMRRRMRNELSRAGAGEFDVKQDAGGLADIEFLVQYLALAEANDHDTVIRYSDNIRQLDALGELGVIDAPTARVLKESYLEYRRFLNEAALAGRPPLAPELQFRASATAVTAAFRRWLDD